MIGIVMLCPDCGKSLEGELEDGKVARCSHCFQKHTVRLERDKLLQEEAAQEAKKKSRYAGFGLRTTAFIFDLGLLFLFSVVVLAFCGESTVVSIKANIAQLLQSLLENRKSYAYLVTSSTVMNFFMFTLLTSFFMFIYKAAFEASSLKATPGKLLVGIYVESTAGTKMTKLQAIFRVVGCYLNYLTFGIGYLIVAITKREQGLHDLLADTFVLRSNEATPKRTLAAIGAGLVFFLVGSLYEAPHSIKAIAIKKKQMELAAKNAPKDSFLARKATEFVDAIAREAAENELKRKAEKQLLENNGFYTDEVEDPLSLEDIAALAEDNSLEADIDEAAVLAEAELELAEKLAEKERLNTPDPLEEIGESVEGKNTTPKPAKDEQEKLSQAIAEKEKQDEADLIKAEEERKKKIKGINLEDSLTLAYEGKKIEVQRLMSLSEQKLHRLSSLLRRLKKRAEPVSNKDFISRKPESYVRLSQSEKGKKEELIYIINEDIPYSIQQTAKNLVINTDS